MCVTDQHDMTLAIKVALNPYTTNNYDFFFLWIIIYKLKTTIFSIQREIIITSLSRKLTKVSTNNFKIDINGLSNPLEMCKNIISA